MGVAHVIELTPYSENWLGGLKGNTLVFNISVVDHHAAVADQGGVVNFYPNPNPQDIVHVSLEAEIKGQTHLTLIDR